MKGEPAALGDGKAAFTFDYSTTSSAEELQLSDAKPAADDSTTATQE